MPANSPTTPDPTAATRRLRPFTIAIVVAVAAIIVVASLAALEFVAKTSSHTVCSPETRLGNVSAWYPYAFAAAPYEGSESGTLKIWENHTFGNTYMNLTSSISTEAQAGDVALGEAAGGNWTIFSATNETVSGAGPSGPCGASMVALLGPPNGPADDGWGGGIIATGLRNDTGLPATFNSSFRCLEFGAPAACAVSSTFDLNFTAPEGEVNTCGQARVATMNVTGQEMEVGIPFQWNGTVHSVPIGPSTGSGMTAWFNYTFPANGGVWQYQYIPGLSGGNSGLVFSYAACTA
jgi:hypothetical protein